MKMVIIMTTTDIKIELRQLIEEQEDINVLQAIHTLLQRTSTCTDLKTKLSSRAIKAEADILQGRVFSKEEIKQRTSKIGK
jgi:hypothetical protein